MKRVFSDIGNFISIAIGLFATTGKARDSMEDNLEEMAIHATAAVVIFFLFMVMFFARFVVSDEIKDGIFAILKATNKVAFLYFIEIVLESFFRHLPFLP